MSITIPSSKARNETGKDTSLKANGKEWPFTDFKYYHSNGSNPAVYGLITYVGSIPEYKQEMLSTDLELTFYDYEGEHTFNNISASHYRHIDANNKNVGEVWFVAKSYTHNR